MLLSPRPREYWPSGWRWRGGVGGQRRLVPSQAPAGSRQPGWDTQGWEAGLHGHTRPLTEVSVLRAHSPSGSRGVQPSLRHRAPWAAKG